MEKIKDKLIELFQIFVYAFAGFGLVMFLAYILVSFTPDMDHISMVAISQVLCYIGIATIGIILCLSNIFLRKISLEIRIILFMSSLYIMGMIYFYFNAYGGLFRSLTSFIGFSIWVLQMSAFVLGSWFIYSMGINNKYNKCLQDYKKNLKS